MLTFLKTNKTYFCFFSSERLTRYEKYTVYWLSFTDNKRKCYSIEACSWKHESNIALMHQVIHHCSPWLHCIWFWTISIHFLIYCHLIFSFCLTWKKKKKHLDDMNSFLARSKCCNIMLRSLLANLVRSNG